MRDGLVNFQTKVCLAARVRSRARVCGAYVACVRACVCIYIYIYIYILRGAGSIYRALSDCLKYLFTPSAFTEARYGRAPLIIAILSGARF